MKITLKQAVEAEIAANKTTRATLVALSSRFTNGEVLKTIAEEDHREEMLSTLITELADEASGIHDIEVEVPIIQ